MQPGEDGAFRYANPRMGKIFGYIVREIVNRKKPRGCPSAHPHAVPRGEPRVVTGGYVADNGVVGGVYPGESMFPQDTECTA